MTETVLYIGGDSEMEGKVLSRDGAVLTVELADGRVIKRHEANFIPLVKVETSGWLVTDIEQPRKRGRPKKVTWNSPL